MNNTHSKLIGYVLWIFGFMGAHRFYYGKPITGTIWLCTLGLLGIGWLIDLFLIPSMDNEADFRYQEGPWDYSLGWICLTFFGAFGTHRFYMGKWMTGLMYLIVTLSAMSAFVGFFPIIFFGGPLLLLGLAYDFWTLNSQLDEINRGMAN